MKNTGDSTKLEGTNNYAQNKTSKNLQKFTELEGRELEETINTLKPFEYRQGALLKGVKERQ
jgi:hypothetical protein